MAAALKAVTDDTECPICTEVFTDPRVLPCLHTYCLKCIKEWFKDKLPGDVVACPLCRQESTIPEEGLEGLPRNFWVEKMLHVRELTSIGAQSPPCSICTYRATSETAKIDSATTYCLECQEAFCEVCANAHRKQKLSRDHKLLQIGDKVKPEELYAQYPPANCDKHVDEALKIYCHDCRLVICMMCYIKDHNSHKCSDVNELVDEFRQQMKTDVSGVANDVDKCQEMLKQLTTEKNDFHQQVSKSEEEIREKTKQLKQMLDRHEELVMTELNSINVKRTKEIEAAYEEVECQLAERESYKKYVHEILEKGTACGIARAANGLHDRAQELLMSDVTQRTVDDLGHAFITFESSNLVNDYAERTLGKLQCDVTLWSTPTVTHVIPGDTGVKAVTSLDDRVYVVRCDKNEVEIYDTATMTLQRRLPVPEISWDASGIAACPRNKCLYLSDWNDPSIHRVDLATDAAKKWPVAKSPHGLSVNGDHNLLVACSCGKKLQEYTTDGRLVREICLKAAVRVGSPSHAIQLSTGDYVVNQFTRKSLNVLSVVGMDGELLHSNYDPLRDFFLATAELRKDPIRSLAVTKHGNILHADEDNNSILVINSLLIRVKLFSLPADVELQEPRALYLDETLDRLYIGECSGKCRVIVLNNLSSV